MFVAQVPPPDHRRRDDAEGHWVETLLAYDNDDSRAVFLRCCLSRMPGLRTDGFEFWFDIYVVSDNEDREPFGIQDGRRSHPFIPAEIRALVLDYVGEALEALVVELKPAAIYRVAKSARLPAKAMRKHQLVERFLERLGYAQAETGFDPAGRQFWLMASRDS